MSYETKTFRLVPDRWIKLSVDNTDDFDAQARGDTPFMLFVGSTEPAAGYRSDLMRTRFTFNGLDDAAIWGKAIGKDTLITAMRRVVAANIQPVELQTLSLSGVTFRVDAAGGTDIGTFSGKTAGSTITLKKDSLAVAISSDSSKVVVGAGALDKGKIKLTFVETHPLAINNGLETDIELEITPLPSGGGGVVPTNRTRVFTTTRDKDMQPGQVVTAGIAAVGTRKWFRRPKGSNPVDVIITGATGGTYTIQSADIGCYIGWFDDQNIDVFPAWVLSAPVVLDSYDSLTGRTGTTNAGNFTASVVSINGHDGIQYVETPGTTSEYRAEKAGPTLDPSAYKLLASRILHDMYNVTTLETHFKLGNVNTYYGKALQANESPNPHRPVEQWMVASVAEMGVPSGSAALTLRTRIAPKSPYAAKPIFSKMVLLADLMPKQIFTFDDSFLSHYTKAFQIFSARGLPMGIAASPNFIGNGNRLNADHLRIMDQSGRVDIFCDTPSDESLTAAKASPTESLAALKQVASYLRGIGISERALNIFCNPYGDWTVTTPMTRAAATVSATGTAMGLDATNANVLQGMTVIGPDVPAGTTVTDKNADGQTLTLSNPVPQAASRPYGFQDRTGPFWGTKLIDAIKADGTFKLGRLNQDVAEFDRFTGQNSLLQPGLGHTSENASQIIATMQTATSRGQSQYHYLHDIIAAGTTQSFNTYEDDLVTVADWLRAKDDAGELKVMLPSEHLRCISGAAYV